MNSAPTREDFEDFLLHEARLLDDRRFRDWMALFTEDGTYWVPSIPDQKSPLDYASLFYDDRRLMETRVTRLEHKQIHIQNPPSRTMHQVGRAIVEKAPGDGEFRISSTLLMAESREDNQRFFAGRQTHHLRMVGSELRIVQKRVDLVNCSAPFEAMAVPI
jgi:3-phenylpropionate/cinnamic acid dioxygenase small subunit